MSNAEYAERHLEAFYLMYGTRTAGAAENRQKWQIKGAGGERHERNQDSGRSRGV